MTIAMMKILFASSVLAAVISAMISWFVSLQLKKLDYKNDYYKIVIKKRLEAYSFIEGQLSVLKNVVFDESDNRPFHMLFSNGEMLFYESQQNLQSAMSLGLWISEKTIAILDDTLTVFLKISVENDLSANERVIEIGKEHYKELAGLRKKLDDSTRKDLLSLYKMKGFGKSADRPKKLIYINPK